jgi:uncharacterized protein YutE (UPF0331/DUF86 family)
MMEEKHYCRNCKGKRNHKKVGEKEVRGSDDEGYLHWMDCYYIIECLGCETVSFLHTYSDSEMGNYNDDGDTEYGSDVSLYPMHLENGREIENIHDLPRNIRPIYRETISAFKVNAYILTAGGFCAIIEAICNNLGVRQDDNISKRIDLLHEKGFLSLNESRRLHSVRFLRNSALHEMQTPEKDQLLIILEIVNHLLESLFLQDKRIGDKIETIIDDYDNFIKLLKSKILEGDLNKELTLNQILGKSKMRLKGSEIKKFEEQLVKEITIGKTIDYLDVAKVEDQKSYKVIKVPEVEFDF